MIYICVKFGKVNGSQNVSINIILSFIILHFFIKNYGLVSGLKVAYIFKGFWGLMLLNGCLVF